MDIGALLQTFIYLVSSSLLYPVLLALSLLVLVIIVQAGGFFAEWLERARLKPCPSQDLPRLLQTGQVVSTLPLNDGIHETGNPTDETLITLSIYGPAVRRGYIQGFDIKNRRVYKMVPPRQKKILLATQALRTLNPL